MDDQDQDKSLLGIGRDLFVSVESLRDIASRSPHTNDAAVEQARAAERFWERHAGDFEPLSDRSDEFVIQKRDISSSPVVRNGEAASSLGRLPLELYELIMDFVDVLEHPDRYALWRLARTSRLLQILAETRIYRKPPPLSTVESQWLFYFALAVSPRRQNLVRSLDLVMLPHSANAELLINLAKQCPLATEMSIQRGRGFTDKDEVHAFDVRALAELVDTLPLLSDFEHQTYLFWKSPDELNPEEQVANGNIFMEEFRSHLQDPRLASVAARLTHIALSGQSGWILDALSPHLSHKLTWIHIGQDTFVGDQFMHELSQRSRFIESLSIHSLSLWKSDFLETIETWADSLVSMRIGSLMSALDEEDRFPEEFPLMKKLQKVCIYCHVSLSSLRVLVHSLPEQQITELELHDLDDPDDYTEDSEVSPKEVQEQLDQELCNFLRHQSTTLKSLRLPSYITVRRDVFRLCLETKSLTHLDAHLAADIQLTEITVPYSHGYQKRQLHFKR